MAQVRKLQLGLAITHYDYNNRQQSSGSAWNTVGNEDNMNSRLLNYATSLKTQTEEIANLYKKGNTRFHNLPKSVESYVNADSLLSDFIFKVQSGKYTNNPTAGYNDLIRIAQTVLPDSEAPKFQEYFQDYLPKTTKSNRNDYSGEISPYVLKVLDNYGYNLVKDDYGRIKVYNSDYSQLLGGFSHYDPESNLGLIVDLSGNVFIGDVRNLAMDADHPVYSYWTSTLKADKNKRKGLYKDINWEALKSDSDDPYYRALELYFNGDYSGTDISLLILGDSRIFAVGKDGKKAYTLDDVYGGIKSLDPEATYYKVDDNGNVAELNFTEDILPKFRASGWEEDNQLGNIGQSALSQIKESKIDENADIAGRNFWDALKANWDFSSFTSGEKHPADSVLAGLTDTAAAGAAGYGLIKGVRDAWRTAKAIPGAVKGVESANKVGKLLKLGLKALKGIYKVGKAGLSGSGVGLAVAAGLEGLESAIRFISWDNIKEDRPAFAKNILNAVANKGLGNLAVSIDGIRDNKHFLEKLNFNNRKDDYTEYLYLLFNSEDGKNIFSSLSDEQKQAYLDLVREYNNKHRASYNKEGGELDKNTTLSESFIWQNINKVDVQSIRNKLLKPELKKEESKQEKPITRSKDRFGEYLKSHK